MVMEPPIAPLQLEEGLYVGKIKDHENLWLVMEHVTPKNLHLWQGYADAQCKALQSPLFHGKQGGQNPRDGVVFFNKVLEEMNIKENEVWVAYIIEGIVNIQPIPFEMEDYWEAMVVSPGADSIKFPQHIKMFMTVTSSPSAWITSHLGIAFTGESVKEGRPKGISMDLHSFAAKVMLMRNPQRRFMMNAPVFHMGKIIAASLPPQSVFAGTQEMKKAIKKGETVCSAEFSAFMKDHPPLLSVDALTHINDFFIVPDPHHLQSLPLLHVHRKDPAYAWIFTDPFKPRGDTQYVLVDLHRLANCKNLSPLSQREIDFFTN